MHKDVDIKNRVVNMFDVDTGRDQNEIIKYLDKNMKVRFHGVAFSASCRYQFTGSPNDRAPNSITVSGYHARNPGEEAVIIR